MVETMTNFAGVAGRSGGDPASARVVLLPAPWEGTVSYGGGTARGPAAILEASLQVETLDDETGLNLEDLSFAVGAAIPAAGGSEEYAARVREAVAPIAASGRIPFVLGGEHSVTIGAARAVRETHPGAHLLSIDAHADLRDAYEGDEYSHACVSRRLLDGGPVTIVGHRSWSTEEAEFAAGRDDVTIVSARSVLRGRANLGRIVDGLGDRVYVTFDVDGLDPSIVPGTGTPEPGGLGWWDALDLLREVFRKRDVVGMDVVELAPIEGSHVSEFCAARLCAKMLTYHELGEGK